MKLVITNLDSKVKQEQLRKAAEAFGKVESVLIVNDIETGKPTGVAYIHMGSRQDGEAALEGLKGMEFNEAKIEIREGEDNVESHNHKKFFSGNGGKSQSFKSGGYQGGNVRKVMKGGGGANRGR